MTKPDLKTILSTKEGRAEARKLLNQYGYDTVDGDAEMEAALKEAEAKKASEHLRKRFDALKTAEATAKKAREDAEWRKTDEYKKLNEWYARDNHYGGFPYIAGWYRDFNRKKRGIEAMAASAKSKIQVTLEALAHMVWNRHEVIIRPQDGIAVCVTCDRMFSQLGEPKSRD